MRKKYMGAALLLATMIAASPAGAQTIDFSSSPPCTFCASFVDSGVTFSDALGGSNLQVADFGSQSDGAGLAIFSDTNSNYLIGDMSFIANDISLTFGNDDVFFTNAGDLAQLQVFLANILVGTAQVALNRDDIMNQTISYSGGAFDSFTFAYTDAAGNPNTGGGNANKGLTEIVDNLSFNGTAVPEPGTWAMMLIGFGAIGGAMRRRRPALLRAVA